MGGGREGVVFFFVATRSTRAQERERAPAVPAWLLSPPRPSHTPTLQIVADAANYPAALIAAPSTTPPTPPTPCTLRARLVARQLEAVDALVRALEEALTGMDAAAATASRAAADGAELARAPSSAAASAATATGAAPSPADAAAALADAARAMAGTAACARAAAGAVEAGGADVVGLRALLRTLKDAPSFDEARVADAIDAVLAAEPAAC